MIWGNRLKRILLSIYDSQRSSKTLNRHISSTVEFIRWRGWLAGIFIANCITITQYQIRSTSHDLGMNIKAVLPCLGGILPHDAGPSFGLVAIGFRPECPCGFPTGLIGVQCDQEQVSFRQCCTLVRQV